jgi:hypothetical protein
MVALTMKFRKELMKISCEDNKNIKECAVEGEIRTRPSRSRLDVAGSTKRRMEKEETMCGRNVWETAN